MDGTTVYSTAYGGLSGATAGAATGATVGAAGGPFGAGLGALVGGAIGAIGGLFGSKKAKKAKKYLKKASAIQSQREANSVADQYRQMLRTARVARAGSLAASLSSGIETSSLSTSALSSIGSQAQYNVQFLAEDRRLFSIYKRYMEKAGQLANDYQNIMSGIQLFSTAVPTLTSAYYKTKAKYTSTAPTTTDPLASSTALNNPSQAPSLRGPETIAYPGWNASLGGVTIQDLA